MAYFDPFDGCNLKGTKQKKSKTKPQKHYNYPLHCTVNAYKSSVFSSIAVTLATYVK